MAIFLDVSGPHGGPGIWIFVGFHQTSSLQPVIGLSFSGIIIYTQVMLVNAWVTVLEFHMDIFLDISGPHGGPEIWIFV